MAKFDPTKLKQRADVKRQSKRKKQAVRREEPPRAQFAGQITKGPRAYIVCSTCSRLFGIANYGIPKQQARQHLEDHRMGRIRKVKGA